MAHNPEVASSNLAPATLFIRKKELDRKVPVESFFIYIKKFCCGKGIYRLMCDVKEYRKVYEKIAELSPEDTMQIILESSDEEEKNFYELVGDYLLQKNQKEAIERKLF